MTNCDLKVTGDKLVITIDLKQRNGKSKSGKSFQVASTLGNITVPGTSVKLGLNAYTDTE